MCSINNINTCKTYDIYFFLIFSILSITNSYVNKICDNKKLFSKHTKYIRIKSSLVKIHMMKISILLAIPIIMATSLVFASIDYNNIYGQQNPANPSLNPQPIRPDQQAALAQQQAQQQQAAQAAQSPQQKQAAQQQQQQAAAAQQQQQQAAAAQQQQQQAAAQQAAAQRQAAAQQQAAAQNNQTKPQPTAAAAQQQQQQAAAAAQQQQQQQQQQPPANKATQNKPVPLKIDTLLNYTNNAVVALHGKHLSSAKQKIAENNLLNIQKMLIAAKPGSSIQLTPTERLP
jgi:type IV secretory pathway VirB10-like protein